MELSIDPGRETGLALWYNGLPRITWKCDFGRDWSKRPGLIRETIAPILRTCRVTEIVIEDFRGHIRPQRVHSMLRCAEIRGMILAACEGIHVTLITKVGRGKERSFQLATQLGFHDISDHEADAIVLGFLGGFGGDRKRSVSCRPDYVDCKGCNEALNVP